MISASLLRITVCMSNLMYIVWRFDEKTLQFLSVNYIVPVLIDNIIAFLILIKETFHRLLTPGWPLSPQDRF